MLEVARTAFCHELFLFLRSGARIGKPTKKNNARNCSKSKYAGLKNFTN